MNLRVNVTVNDKKFKKILERFEKAKEEINQCWYELKTMELLSLEEAPAEEAEAYEDIKTPQ